MCITYLPVVATHYNVPMIQVKQLKHSCQSFEQEAKVARHQVKQLEDKMRMMVDREQMEQVKKNHKVTHSPTVTSYCEASTHTLSLSLSLSLSPLTGGAFFSQSKARVVR